MKIFYLMFIALCTFQWAGAQDINIPDTNFKQALIDLGIDGGDGEISETEAAAVTYLNVSDTMISDLTGIEYFTSLEYLFCNSNDLTSLDVNGLTSLKLLDCSENDLTSLDVNSLMSLEYLYCNSNDLTSLDVSGLTSLIYLYCYSNDLTSLDIRNTPALIFFNATDNPDLECIVVDDVNRDPSTVSVDQSPIPYTTEPCLILDFDDLEDAIDDAGISPYLAAVFAGTVRSAEESCSAGNKGTAIFTLKSLKLMVRRSRQVGRMTASQASELVESINMLIGNIRSGAVDCNGGHQKNILDWINDWFGWNSLEEPEQAGALDNYIPSSSTVQNVYPNPTSGRVNFAQPDQQVVVYNMLGKVMERAEGADHVDLSTYQPGVYVIQLIKGEERSVHQVVRR